MLKIAVIFRRGSLLKKTILIEIKIGPNIDKNLFLDEKFSGWPNNEHLFDEKACFCPNEKTTAEKCLLVFAKKNPECNTLGLMIIENAQQI